MDAWHDVSLHFVGDALGGAPWAAVMVTSASATPATAGAMRKEGRAATGTECMLHDAGRVIRHRRRVPSVIVVRREEGASCDAGCPLRALSVARTAGESVGDGVDAGGGGEV